ncbi:MAG: dTDP-4-amino-4,6-dideoxygalactose transaminase [Actinomycetota bacterium]|nr:dTDP-4-amino-4,6-dideoxygalactose transaminase [Actinomycetota bacterium]
MKRVPFNHPQAVGAELEYLREAIASAELASGGRFTKRCVKWLEERTGADCALLVHSATAALEMIALLLELESGDEVIMPSFTFVSTANAVALRGATPVFVDVRPDTLNIDEAKIEDAITSRTKAVIAVHYAGVPCEMDALNELAARRGLAVVEDAAQALLSTYRGRPAGALGDAAAISFHETKNLLCGEGGALLIRRPEWVERSLVLRDKGTNRNRFLRGEVDRYSWVDLGSSYGLGELAAAFLWAQLERSEEVLAERRRVWQAYHQHFAPLEERGLLRRPVIPDHVGHNAHLYYLLVRDLEERTRVIKELDRRDVHAVFHYVPLHSSPAGRLYGRAHGDLAETDRASARLVRLPLWHKMPDEAISRVVSAVDDVVSRRLAV